MPTANTCPQCNSIFVVTDDDRVFLKKLAPVIGKNTFELPEPTLCPDCRQMRRQAAVNQLVLYRNTCALTGKPVVSHFHPDSGYTVYSQEAWWGDGWDPLSYGREFDFTRPFFEQFQELAKVVPYPALSTAYQYDENSEYTNYSGKNKNCYLIFDSDENRDCYYSYSLNGCSDCIDCHRVRRSELTAHSVDCLQCYNAAYVHNCQTCSDSMFLSSCIGCKNCIFCVNLKNKEYFVENKEVSPEQFTEIRSSLVSREAINTAAEHFQRFILGFPHRAMHGFQTENCTGDYLLNCKNAHNCFDGENLWDCRHAFQSPLPLKDSMDTEQSGEGERMYETSNCVYNTYDVYFSVTCWPVRSTFYSAFCGSISDCFGCTGLRHKKYCILNKQYSKEEYETLVPKMIEHMKKSGEWGQFFPPSLALFPYNETIAFDHVPLTKEQALALGYTWRDEAPADRQAATFVPPSTITDVPDSVVQERLACSACGKNYKVTAQELALLRRKNLPLPMECFFCRYRSRLKSRNPRKLWDRKCAKCEKAIRTTYSPERPEIVCCEECYLATVF